MTHHVPSYPGSPHEDHWPSYDPIGPHHHPKHPPYMIDRCADECDDQLPLFSQVGRGLQGEGYKVEVSYDDTDETYLTGYYHDPHTGADTLDWVSENINGGRLYYSYHIRNFTDPQTFTITFRYVRPNRDADEEGTVWSWTSPAIPYVGDEDMGDLIASWVSTLYLRKKGENWNWRQHEKLVYPEGMTHQSVNAPGPEEGWTVNLTYGIDEDCDIVVPTVEDLAKIIGMDPDEIYNLVEQAVPTDVIPDGMNVKEYIDSKTGYTYDVKIHDDSTDYLSVSKSGPDANKKTTFTLKSLFEAGKGILFKKEGGKTKILANLLAGPGIQITGDDDGPLTITNTQVGGNWSPDLVAGVDFDYTWHNGWYMGDMVSIHTDSKFVTNPTNIQPPRIKVILSKDNENKIIGSELWIGASNSQNGPNLEFRHDLFDDSKFYLKHAGPVYDPDEGVDNRKTLMLSVTFKGDYAALNKLKVIKNDGGGGIWNAKGSNTPALDTDLSATADWYACGGSWPVNLYFIKNIYDEETETWQVPGSRQFMIGAVTISDGWNSQYANHPYDKNHLVIAPWANFSQYITLG